jgi:hypothetical protein
MYPIYISGLPLPLSFGIWKLDCIVYCYVFEYLLIYHWLMPFFFTLVYLSQIWISFSSFCNLVQLLSTFLTYQYLTLNNMLFLIGCWCEKPSFSAQWASSVIFISWSLSSNSICGNDLVITLSWLILATKWLFLFGFEKTNTCSRDLSYIINITNAWSFASLSLFSFHLQF